MRVTISVKSKSDIEAATVALNHFIREKKPDDGTSTSWGIGINSKQYFSVTEKKSGNYSVIGLEWMLFLFALLLLLRATAVVTVEILNTCETLADQLPYLLSAFPENRY